MKFKRTAQTGTVQEVYALEKPLGENDFQVKYDSVADTSALLQEDFDKYSKLKNEKGEPAVYIPHWRELILAFQRVNTEVDLSNLELKIMSSFHAQARRRGIVEDMTPVTVVSVIRTSDDLLLYGVRGGKPIAGQPNTLAVGQGNSVPGGHVMPQTRYSSNPILSSFYEELSEEAGIGKNEVFECALAGYQTDPQFKSLCFVVKGNTILPSSEVSYRHFKAMEVYSSAKKDGLSELDSRKAISEAGLRNIDAWENENLIFIPNDQDYLSKLIESGRISDAVKGKEYKLIDNSIGALIMHNFLR